MADDTTLVDDAPDTDAADDTTEPQDQPDDVQDVADEEIDYKAKYEAQQKINKSLEAKLKKSAQGDGHARAKELEAELARLQGREAEYQAEQKQREAERAALAKADERILKAEIRAVAAGKLADPQDALRFLDLSEFEVGSDGEADSDAIAEAIDDLIKKKPYLAAQGKRFQGGADGGARKESSKSIDDQIAEAQKARNYQLVIALKQKKAAEAAGATKS